MKRDAPVIIGSLTYPVYFGSNLWDQIHNSIKPFLRSGQVFILTDHNTERSCLPLMVKYIPALQGFPVFSIEPGDQSKDQETLGHLWQWLISKGAGTKSLLINLGGGVVTDLGGFAAGTFKRGIGFINVPTSMIGQVDAAVGGKTGININGIKNQAGGFFDPLAVFIIPEFLKTLPANHFRSGIAEVIKSAALSGNGLLQQLKAANNPEGDLLDEIICKTVEFKCSVVSGDPFDKADRRMLNFGHTIGHALEALGHRPGMPGLLHGEAVAAGMVCETYLSELIAGLSEAEADEIIAVIKMHFVPEPIDSVHFDELVHIIGHDKKKTGNKYSFSLLRSVGHAALNCETEEKAILASFQHYNQIIRQ